LTKLKEAFSYVRVICVNSFRSIGLQNKNNPQTYIFVGSHVRYKTGKNIGRVAYPNTTVKLVDEASLFKPSQHVG